MAIAIPNYNHNFGTSPLLLFVRTLPGAEQPFRVKPSDVTLELTAITRVDNRTEDNVGEVNLFDTGLQAIIPAGTYLEIVANPSLYKQGYMLAHGTHIIQPEDRSNIVIPLYKFKDGPDIELPFRVAQLLPHSAHYTRVDLAAAPRQRNEERNFEPAPPTAADVRKANAQNQGRPLKGGNRFM